MLANGKMVKDQDKEHKTMEYTKLLRKLIAQQDLTESEGYEAITAMLRGEMSAGQTGAFLAAMAAKGESVAEITGGARAIEQIRQGDDPVGVERLGLQRHGLPGQGGAGDEEGGGGDQEVLHD